MSLAAYPYPSRRSAVLATEGMVATSQPLAAQAGLEALRDGGNAVDAAIACAAALTVVEPTSNGIGSDAFAILWDGERLHGLNASGVWPAAEEADRYRASGTTMPECGWAAVTVPGAVSAWQALSERFGRLEPGRLLEAAIGYAERGYPVSPVVSQLWNRAAPGFLDSTDPALAGWAEVFAPGGSAPAAGVRFESPGHARCLRGLVERGFRDFYDGEIAGRIADYASRTGGRLTRDDLAGHAAEWVEPISIRYRDHELWEIPPNGQGIAALQALGMLADHPLGAHPHASAESWHLQIEAMKLGFADAYRYVADPRLAEVPTRGMLDPAYLAERGALIGDTAAAPLAGKPPGGGTVYLCTADRDGMMVSFIQSNYMGFGSGVVVPEFGVSLQNRGAGFDLDPAHPNVATPGKRPRHTIIPAFLTRGGQPVAPFGVMGGEMQPQGHVQVANALVDHGMNAQTALDAPRWKVTGGRGVAVEAETPESVVAALRARGHAVTVVDDRIGFGRGQIIRRRDDGVLEGGSEPRADGAVAGW